MITFDDVCNSFIIDDSLITIDDVCSGVITDDGIVTFDDVCKDVMGGLIRTKDCFLFLRFNSGFQLGLDEINFAPAAIFLCVLCEQMCD